MPNAYYSNCLTAAYQLNNAAHKSIPVMKSMEC